MTHLESSALEISSDSSMRSFSLRHQLAQPTSIAQLVIDNIRLLSRLDSSYHRVFLLRYVKWLRQVFLATGRGRGGLSNSINLSDRPSTSGHLSSRQCQPCLQKTSVRIDGMRISIEHINMVARSLWYDIYGFNKVKCFNLIKALNNIEYN